MANDFNLKDATLNKVIRFCEREMETLLDDLYFLGYKRALCRIIDFCEDLKYSTLKEFENLSPSDDAKVEAVAKYLARDDDFWYDMRDEDREDYLDEAREIINVANMAVMK